MAANARLREQMSFFLVPDPLPEDEQTMDFVPVLFVAGPDVAREPQYLLRVAITSLGIATAWYGSLAPFLANAKVMDRATAAMELADAGMPVDLAWLTDLSVPLFLAYMALQLSHEAAHAAVAKAKGFDVALPTVVPSILSGTLGSITSLKSPPKNRQDLLEFAVAGPLVGMIG